MVFEYTHEGYGLYKVDLLSGLPFKIKVSNQFSLDKISQPTSPFVIITVMARLLLQLLLLAAAGVDSAALKPRQDNFPKPGEPMCVGPGGKVPDPEGAAPRKVSMKSTGSIAEAQRVKMR